MELIQLSLADAARLIGWGEISPVELAQAHLDRIARLDPAINCFITLTAESALSEARQAESEITRGEYRGPLHGIPLALKDLFQTRGVRTTAGSKFFEDSVPEEDAAVVQKLRAAGAVLLGKLNMHEIALGVTTNNPHYGACHNPWALERSPGGSSGGSGAALAAGLCMGSLGTDTGGSIRIPASLCGVVGLKPTYGRVSLRGVFPLSWNLDHAGPMARRVEDVALLLQIIAGYDPLDPGSRRVPVADYSASLERGIAKLRVGLAAGSYFHKTDAEVQSLVQAAAQTFKGLGAQVSEVELPEAYDAALANGQMTTSDAAAFHHERLQSRPEDFGEDVRRRLEEGQRRSAVEYARLRRTQAVLRRRFEDLFENFDLLLAPATPIPAPFIQGPDAVEQARLLTRFTAPFNLTGLPALAMPCGFTAAGLPAGLQLVAAPWEEGRLLQAAYAYEQAAPWHQRLFEVQTKIDTGR